MDIVCLGIHRESEKELLGLVRVAPESQFGFNFPGVEDGIDIRTLQVNI